MPRRLHQTLADYVVIAISPALIMLLVGSLVYFLLAVFYQGQDQFRLHWVMTCFVFAAVLIARISIEEGFERAVVFAAPLALLVGIAANRFMEIQGTWVDHVGWIVNFALIGVIWWCAHKLTWDCTVIDDAEDASGEGLMQVAGLERPQNDANTRSDEQRQLEGTTSREVPAGFWQRYVERQRKPHAPGVWVVYFSLAALPIFGFGQWFIPASASGARRYVFSLLLIYVGAGLSLLVTTSFLGLRRYLRQRRIEMPTLMANLWLGTGVAIALVLLVVAALLPRPSAEYAVSQLPFTFGSPENEASKIAPIKRDGTQDDEPAPAAKREPSSDEPNDDAPSDDEPSGTGNQPEGEADDDQQSGTAERSSQTQGDGGRRESSSGKGKDSRRDAKSKGNRDQRGNKQQQKNTQRDNAESNKRSSAQRDESTSTDAEQADDEPSSDETEPSEDSQPAQASSKSDQRSEPREAAPPAQSPSVPTPPIDPLLAIFKWVFYALFALVVLYAIWRYWRDIAAAVRSFLHELRQWWDAMWGNRRDAGVADDEPLAIQVPLPPFSSYADPFASGQAERESLEELVRYSFEAFEAWSREHGCPRDPEQTPHELAREVGRLNSFIAAEARTIAELYARVAYSGSQVPAASAGQLRQLWQKMQSAPRQQPSVVGDASSPFSDQV